MTSAAIQCSQCHSPLPPELWNRNDLNPCPACGTRFMAAAFPALTQPKPAPASGQIIVEEGEASCFFHARKRAETSCSMCGRFLCQLCDFDLQGKHVCPNCLQISQKQDGPINLEKRRFVHDSAALAIALLPILAWPITIVTGPIAVVLALISFKKPNSLVTRNHVRAWLAILIGGLQIFLWSWGILVLFLELART